MRTMIRITTRWAIASALVAVVAAGCTAEATTDTGSDGGTGGGSTGGSSGTGGGATGGGTATGGSTGTGGSEAEAGTGGSAGADTMGVCEACVYGHCAGAVAACDADPSCKDREDAFYDCLMGGGSVGDCSIPFTAAGDADAGTDAGAAAGDIATCVDMNCQTICAGSTDAGTGAD